MPTVISNQDDTVDLICYRHYGYTRGVVEQVLIKNPGLAAMGPELPQGTKILLPDLREQPSTNVVNLWD